MVGAAPGAAASPCAGYGRGGRSSRAGHRPTLEAAITPALGALLYVTFLAVPFRALLIGVLRVLLTPCVDYVIVFTRLAGGASDRPLASSPLLMLLQILLLPILLARFLGADAASTIDPVPFVEAFLLLILVPLDLAALTQLLAERVVAVLRACRRGRRDADARRAARNGGLRARDPVACPFGMNAAGE